MAKFLTLNTHSWLEDMPEEKLVQLAEQIILEDYDVICLQEINQLIAADVAVLDYHYVPTASHPVIRDNHYVKRLVDLLAQNGHDYYWSWAYNHIGYDIYNEGVAILSKTQIKPYEVLVSEVDDETDYHTRRVLVAETEVTGVSITVASVHLSWWDKGFQGEWTRLTQALSKAETPLVLMGDFNNPEYQEGYQAILASPLQLQDTYEVADKVNGRYTIDAEIDGWSGNQSGLRIDYVFVSHDISVRHLARVFDGDNGPILSDHFGLTCEVDL